jgi:hypothetical protein
VHNSGKTITILHILDILCSTIPGVRIAVFRKSEKNLKQNTIPSYRKLLALKNKIIPIVDMTAKYPNGSEILFNWADITKDPDCDNVKGGEYTWAFFNEANQIDESYINIARTRVGRWNEFVINGKKVSIKPIIFTDFNPTNNWVKTRYYDKYINNNLPINIFFQLSLPHDNPFLTKDYLASLEYLPEAEYNRFVKGNWDYSDDPNQLIKWEWIKDNVVEPTDEANKLGVDVAREGNDKTVFSFVKDNIQTKFEQYSQQDTITTSKIMIERMKEKNIGANQVSIDVVGLGAGVVDYAHSQGYYVNAYNSGSSPNSNLTHFIFKNKRAESYWNMREALESGERKILNDPELHKQLMNTRYFVKDKVLQIESKMEIKKRLGQSPDKADATIISFDKPKDEFYFEVIA